MNSYILKIILISVPFSHFKTFSFCYSENNFLKQKLPCFLALAQIELSPIFYLTEQLSVKFIILVVRHKCQSKEFS